MSEFNSTDYISTPHIGGTYEAPVSSERLYDVLDDGAQLDLHSAREDLIDLDRAREMRAEADRAIAHERENAPTTPQDYIRSIGRNIEQLRAYKHQEQYAGIEPGFEDLVA